jgi:triosephosphate isomerase
MALRPRPLVAGNWKMNGLRASTAELQSVMAGHVVTLSAAVDLLICPPATLILPFARLAEGSELTIGAQDCHPDASGAHTGDLSAEILADAGATHVIVGHSERRSNHGESSELVCRKALAAHRAGLVAIICIGETEAERDAGRTLEVVGQQLAQSVPAAALPQNTVLAYEPVWAIGSGRTPTRAEVKEVHGAIRRALLERFGTAGNGFRILYGGSVKPTNASDLMSVENVDGALVGGASLKAEDFLSIARAYPLTFV